MRAVVKRGSVARSFTTPLRAPILVAVLVLAAPLAPGARGGGQGRPAPGSLHAQALDAGGEGRDLVQSRRLHSVVSDAQRVTYISGPAVFRCEEGTTIRADSVVDFSGDRFRQLIGDVEIEGPETRLRADRVHQSDQRALTEAWGGVVLVNPEAEMEISGDTLVLAEGEGRGGADRLTVTGGEPRAVLRLQGEEAPGAAPDPPDGGGAPAGEDAAAGDGSRVQAPDTVFGDRLHLEGQDRFAAAGDVRVRRSDMYAFGDSLDYDRERGTAELLAAEDGLSRIEGDEFDLEARRLDLLIEGDRVSEILAGERALLTGRDVVVEAPRIRIFLSEGEVEEMVAVRGAPQTDDTGPDGEPAEEEPRRPEAVAEDFLLRADSIRVTAPSRELERVTAVGGARGESLSRDSLNTFDTPEILRRDWIEGDTIVAHFLPTDAPPAAEAGPSDAEEGRPRYRLDRLVASGEARTLYRMAPQDTVEVVSVDEPGAPGAVEDVDADPGEAAGADGDDRPPEPRADSLAAPGGAGAPQRVAVHYVLGDRITIVLEEGAVERMEVEGRTRGLYLEPVVRRDPRPAGGLRS